MYTERSTYANSFRQGCDPPAALNRKVFAQHPLQFGACAAGNADQLVTRSLAGHHLDRGARHGKDLGKELHYSKVRSPIPDFRFAAPSRASVAARESRMSSYEHRIRQRRAVRACISPTVPVIAVRSARGCTRTGKVAPRGWSCMGIT